MKAYITKEVSKRTGRPSWRLVIYVTKDEGGPRRVNCGKFPLKKDADGAVEKAMAEVRLTLSVADPTMTVGELLDRCMRDHWEGNTRPRTHARYKDLIRLHVRPRLGRKTAATLSPLEVAEWQAVLLKTLAPATVMQARLTLHKAYSWGAQVGLVARNPVALVAKPRLAPGKIVPPSRAQIAKVIAAAEGTTLYLPVVIAAGTGMRRGEVLALRWGDVDLLGRKLLVTRSLSSAGKSPCFSAPKTARGNRVVAMPDFVVRVLAAAADKRDDDALVTGVDLSDDDLVCCNADGEPLDPDGVSHNFYHLLKRRKLPHMRFHDLRHAVASDMLERGVRVDAVQAHLGHADASVTLGVYGHLMNEVQHEAMEQWGAGISVGDPFPRAFPESPDFPEDAGKDSRENLP